ncbi:MAG: T9SS type A sorting domain-containing protein, partial [Bacteroidota bacterium]|nr:T9SS type A sorting domain-containing protein [Bacteroidota bacterium]
GEEDPSGTNPDTWPALDYMALVYSFDGTTWYEFAQAPFTRFASAVLTNGAFAETLPAFLNNKQFYLGFRWNNDPLIGGPFSVSVDNLLLQASARKIESELAHGGRENLGAGQEVYFYSVQDGDLLGRIKNNSTNNFGCTNLFVEKAGTGTFNLYQDRNGSLHKVSDKVLRIEASQLYKASQTVTLYFTEDQLKSLEAATGASRTAFGVYQVNATGYAAAGSKNTTRYAATYTDIPGSGGSYSFTFGEKVNGSFALGYQVSALGLTTTAGTTDTQSLRPAKWEFSPIYPNPGSGVAAMTVTVPEKQKVVIEVINVAGQVLFTRSELLVEGLNKISLPVDRLRAGAYRIQLRGTAGNVLNTQSYTRQ